MDEKSRRICVYVNGAKKELAVDLGESLADMLRNKLGLTSVKKGCGVGECGGCTVLLNDHAVQSCIYLAVWADNCNIRTLEGIKLGDDLHPLQKAFIQEAAVQCGFCTPGFIMAGIELVESGKKYTREEVKKHIEGHLCRCTGYENIVNAIMAVVGNGDPAGD